MKETKEHIAAFDNEVQAALIRPGHRLTVSEVAALKELDKAFQKWARDHGLIWFDNDTRLARAIADVLHIELVGDDDAD